MKIVLRPLLQYNSESLFSRCVSPLILPVAVDLSVFVPIVCLSHPSLLFVCVCVMEELARRFGILFVILTLDLWSPLTYATPELELETPRHPCQLFEDPAIDLCGATNYGTLSSSCTSSGLSIPCAFEH